MQRLSVFAILLGAAAAAADDAASVDRHAQLQADLGLSVIQLAGDHDDMYGAGVGFSSGAFVSWALGLGPQTSSTPFIALDILVGYRS